MLNEGGNIYMEDFKAPGGPKFNNGRMYSIFILSRCSQSVINKIILILINF